MEAILTDCVRNSLQQLMYRNAIFLCERLCAEFPTEKNLQLLASCYLQNNQAHCAYHILKGTHLAGCRYLLALACFQMDLLKEAESVLSPNESSAEVPNGAAGHYLLGLVYRYTDRKKMAVNHFNQALSMDPLLWVANEELCILGAADEATLVFENSASIFIQKQYIQRGLASQGSRTTNEDLEVTSNRIMGSEDVSPRKLKHTQDNNLREISGNCYGTTSNQPQYSGPTSLPFYSTPSSMATQSQLSGVVPPPICRNALPNGPSTRTYGADSSQRVTINSAVAGPRRKFVDEGKLRKVGKAHFEMVDYLKADRAFCRARIASPYSLEGMDIYSTVLYHLKEDMKLSYLAQELISTDRLAPQSWCAMGNCYSLQKDHETALKNF